MDKYEYYVAYDGKSFDSRCDCEDYEMNKLKEYVAKKEIRFLNEDLSDHENSQEKPLMALEESAAVYIKNKKAYKILSTIADYYGIPIPDDVGFWDYDSFWGWRKIWSILEEEAKAINEKIDKYNKIIRE
jgi:hypothetical protein